MVFSPVSLPLIDADATAACARALGVFVTAGDTILLSGDVGAGKTHFARALIQSLLLVPEDVPSPTFTLVQTYDTPKGGIWHTDLYRLTSAHEVEELGLIDAFETAICLVEWPDRLGTLIPKAALSITLSQGPDDTRLLVASWTDTKWNHTLNGWPQ